MRVVLVLCMMVMVSVFATAAPSRGDSKCKTLCAAKGGQCYTLAREAHDETDINKIIDIVKEVSQCYGEELLKCYKKCKEGPNFFSKWPISLWWCVLNYWYLKSNYVWKSTFEDNIFVNVGRFKLQTYIYLNSISILFMLWPPSHINSSHHRVKPRN